MELLIAAALAILGLQFLGVPIAWTWSNYFGAALVGLAIAFIASSEQRKPREVADEVLKRIEQRYPRI